MRHGHIRDVGASLSVDFCDMYACARHGVLHNFASERIPLSGSAGGRFTDDLLEQADKLFREIIEIADDKSGDYITTSDGKRVVDHENIQRSRLRVDARKWAAARLAPKKYGDQMTHDVKGGALNFQPAILIEVGDGRRLDEVSASSEAGGGVLLDGNGDIVRAR
jgi:hypothetical protein